MSPYLIFILTYLLGAIPFAYFAGKLKGIDVRKQGSGNIGTTNAFRLLGAKLGALVLVGDAFKGGLAAYLGLTFFGPWGGIIGGSLAMLGHSFNPFFGFRPSGKGVASGFGIIIVLMPKIMIIAISLFIIVVAISRYVSLGSILGALSVSVLVFVFPNQHIAYQLFGVLGPIAVVVLHRKNLQRLFNGTERRLGDKKE